MIIALDGPSGTGKSSTAKAVAKRLDLVYLNTGAMYRGLTFLALQHNIKSDNIKSLTQLAQNTQFDFDSMGELLLNSQLVHEELVSTEVSEWVSHYCKNAEVRAVLTNKQRELASVRPSILDGRDIGTVVFPNADYKFYLVADYKIRAERRFKELQSKGIEQSIESIEANLIERDKLDTEREEAPLVQAHDAILIDTTQMSFNQQVEHICSVVRVVATETNDFTKTPKSKTMTKFIYGTQEDLDEMLKAEAAVGGAFNVTEEELAPYFDTMHGLEIGKVVNGIVRQITDQEVLIDVAFKSEGVVDMAEFKDVENLEVGSEVEVFIEALEDQEGRLVLSKQRADFIRVWEKIREAFERDDIVQGKLVRRIKGGLVVDIFGIEAFLPGSQIDLRQIPDLNNLIGQTMDLKVIKVNKARRNIVVSRRIVLEAERSKLRGDILENLEKGQARKGIVKNITDFGAFIDLGGVDGLLHITDMSYKRISHPSEMVSLGHEIEVKVLDFNENKERISLGLKQLQDHPWKDAAAKFPEGSTVVGKLVSITDYGAFMELEDGIEGLIHVSEMSWTQHVKHPSKMLNVGDEISAIVLKVDVESEKISLGLKQLEPDPWQDIEEELPPGAKVTGEIRNLASFGAFVEIKEGVDGLIHVSDMSWTKKIAHPSEMLKKGDQVECVVLAVDRDKRRISLSMKHLEEDPWENVNALYPTGKEVKGAIIRMLDRGVVVELDSGLEGFVPTNKLTMDNIKVPSEAFKIGDEIPAVVIEIDQNGRKLFLSTTDFFKGREDAEVQAYLSQHQPSANTLGEAGLEEAMK